MVNVSFSREELNIIVASIRQIEDQNGYDSTDMHYVRSIKEKLYRTLRQR